MSLEKGLDKQVRESNEDALTGDGSKRSLESEKSESVLSEFMLEAVIVPEND